MAYIKTFENFKIDLDIRSILRKISLYKVSDKIYSVVIKDRYLRSMVFLRYQEFYESSSDTFRGQNFKISDYIDWYKSEDSPNGVKSDIFTYAKDWSGFNLPSESIEKCISGIVDLNTYDKIMISIINTIRISDNSKFYLLGVDKLNIDQKEIDRLVDGTEENVPDIIHELAHGFYYVDPSYKRKMNTLIRSMDSEYRGILSEMIIDWGYTKGVLNDEIQAHMSTGFVEDMYNIGFENYSKPFIDFFKSYVSNVGVYKKKIDIKWNL